MWKAGIAGALALATIGSSLSLAGESRARHEFRPAARTGVVLTNAQIARIKTVLKLTRAQEQYWPPVAAALRDLRHQGDGMNGSPEVRQVSTTTASIDSSTLRRLSAAAMPLIMSLGADQKRDAMVLARTM